MSADDSTQPSAEQLLSQNLADLWAADVERRFQALAAERAQDLSSLAIARALHEEVENEVAVARGLLQLVLREAGDSKTSKQLARAEEQLGRAVTRLQGLILEIRPPGLEKDGLARTLRSLLNRVCAESELECDLVDELGKEPPVETAITLYWITYQAVDNVRKYAHASSIRVELREYGGGFMIRVTDDGRGFDPSRLGPDAQSGLRAMNQRAEIRDGWWHVDSRPGRGTTVEVWVPASIAFEGGVSASLG